MRNAQRVQSIQFSRKFYVSEKTKKSTRIKSFAMKCHVQNTSFLYTHDANKNVTEVFYLATQNGLAAHYEYSPFGELRDFSHLSSTPETSNSEVNAITETSNSEVNAIAEALNSSNPSPGDLIGWRDTRITEVDIRTFNPFRFSSEYHDDELNLIYYNYRHYDPATGRFFSRDPIEEQGGTNLYNFTMNDPINLIDMLGLETLTEIILIANEGMFQVGIRRTPSGVVAIYQKKIFYDKYEITINYTARCEEDIPIIDNIEISGNMLGSVDIIGIGIVRTYSYTQTHGTKFSSDDKNNIQEINYKIKVKKTWSIGISLFGLDTGQSLSKTNTIAEKTITLTKSCCKK